MQKLYATPVRSEGKAPSELAKKKPLPFTLPHIEVQSLLQSKTYLSEENLYAFLAAQKIDAFVGLTCVGDMILDNLIGSTKLTVRWLRKQLYFSQISLKFLICFHSARISIDALII